jgi:hypothetical protein
VNKKFTDKQHPCEHEGEGFTQHFVRATGRGISRHKGKIIVAGVGVILSGVLYGLGEWAGPQLADWWKTHHMISDSDLTTFRKDHWELIRLEGTVSNLVNSPGSVGKTGQKLPLTASAKSAKNAP